MEELRCGACFWMEPTMRDCSGKKNKKKIVATGYTSVIEKIGLCLEAVEATEVFLEK